MKVNFLTNEIVNFFTPGHESTVCSDVKPEGDWLHRGLIRCARCYLLNMIQWQFHNSEKYRLHLIVEEIHK